MQSRRQERVREMLKRELSTIVHREFSTAGVGLIVVNDVMMAGDLKSARVFVSVIGTSDQQKRGMELLATHRTKIQSIVGSTLYLKFTPQLKFTLDDSIARGDKVLRIMDEIEKTLPKE